jgi:hypothetical protein
VCVVRAVVVLAIVYGFYVGQRDCGIAVFGAPLFEWWRSYRKLSMPPQKRKSKYV